MICGSIVGSGTAQAPSARCGVPGSSTWTLPAVGHRRLGTAPGTRRRHVLTHAREAGHRRGERPAAEAPAGAQVAAHLQRHALRQLLDGELHAEVVRDRVKAAGVDEPGARGDRGRVVGEVAAVDELRLAGEVEVVGAGRRARGHDGIAVQDVGADGGGQHARGRGQRGAATRRRRCRRSPARAPARSDAPRRRGRAPPPACRGCDRPAPSAGRRAHGRRARRRSARR